jgi:hypothetical protein
MAVAELTKAEESHIERMAGAFSKPTVDEAFNNWMTRAVSEQKKEEKKEGGKHRPREISLDDRDDAEREFIKAVGQKDESTEGGKPDAKAKESAKESPNAAEKDAAKGAEQRTQSEKPAKAGEKPAAGESGTSPIEPLPADRHWSAKFEGKDVGKGLETHWQQVRGRIGVALEYVNQQPEKAQIEQGWRALVESKKPASQSAFVHDLATALAEIANPGEVLRHITLQAADRAALGKSQNWQQVRAAVQAISKHYAGESQTSAKPRAPKPPAEVGGRGAATDDAAQAAARDNNFRGFDAAMRQRYAHAR